jgi:hypothetical protein
MLDRSTSDRALQLGIVGLLIVVGIVSFDRARRARYDFHHFYLDARYVWEHGALNPDFENADRDQRRQLPFYLPVVPLALSPITALGRVPAAIFWAAAQVAALGYSLRVLLRWSRVRETLAPPAAPMAIALLLALPAFIEAGKFNQLSYFVLASVLGGIRALDRERPLRAGALLGAAAVMKLLPAIFLPWLLLKRRWSAAVMMVAASAVLAVLPTMVVFGPGKSIEYHKEWWQHNVRGDAASGMLRADLDDHFIDRRNQSITQVIARLTWTEHKHAAPWQPLKLEPQTALWISRLIAVSLGLMLLATTARPWSDLSPLRRHAEAAVYAIGMLVFSPLLRQYYLVWAVPALVLLARAATNPRSPHVRRLGWIALATWAGGMIAWIWPITRMYGAHLIMLLAIGVLLLRATQGPALPSGTRLARSTRSGTI